MKTLKITTLLLLLAQCCFGQHSTSDTTKIKTAIKPEPVYKGSMLDSIRVNLEQGDKQALFRVAQYLDSNSIMTEFLGYHILHTMQSEIARRLINENCLFLSNEFTVDTKTTAKDFLAFLMGNINKISFSYDAYAYLITPLDKRDAKYEVRELTQNRKAELKQNAGALLNNELVKHNNIDQLISYKDPAALFNIVSLLYANRSRFDSYQSNTDQYINLIQLLTGTEIGVEDGYGKISFHIDNDFKPDSRLNLLIYFARNYKLYHWNEKLGIFGNDSVTVNKFDKETILFKLLNSKTDSIAQNAFLKLTAGNVQRVQALANEYDIANMEFNRVLPTFPYRFLKQLVELTNYCRKYHISFLGSRVLRKNIERLRQELPFKERHQLENKLAKEFTLNDITAFEYWSLVNEEDFELTYSAGRILDMFYSKNWNKIVHNPSQLDLYLKKASLYSNIGIIGICNNYAKKFVGNGNRVTDLLKQHHSSDDKVNVWSTLAIKFASQRPAPARDDRKTNDGNFDADVNDLRGDFLKIIDTVKDSEKRDRAVLNLYSKINYSQIGLGLELMENYKANKYVDKYSFVSRDFGFFMNDFNKPTSRAEFIHVYKTHTEVGLYTYYLNKAGIDFANTDQSLNYDKIYEILKFGIGTAFSGGGGSTYDNEVYAVIKLLELKFKTTLGFPKKVCNSAGTYGCNSLERAQEWMNYLEDKALLKLEHRGPISFLYPLKIDQEYRF